MTQTNTTPKHLEVTMSNKRIDRGIVFGKKAKYTNWGIKGYSRGMYVTGGFDFYVYGIQGLFNIIIDKRWGSMVTNERRF